LPGLERQEQATPAPAKTAPARHSDYLRQALDSLSRAHRALCTITSDVSIENLERLHSVRRSLQEDLEVASSCTVDERLQVVLKLHSQALEDCKLAEEKRETEKPEVIMLRRSIAEIHRRTPKTNKSKEDHSEGQRSSHLQALKEALALRSRQAEVAKVALLSEDTLLSANLSVAKNALREAVMEGQRLEEMRDEAAAEVQSACKALAQLSNTQGEDRRMMHEKAKELETFLRGPVAPWRLSALHQPTGSLGTTSLLDPEEYRVNRENATAQADKDLAAAMEVHSSTREQLRKSLQEEAQRQKDEEVHFAEELQSLREHLVSRRHSVDTALASQMTEKDLRLQEAQRQLTLELRQIEAQERSNQDNLRQEVRRARQRLEQASATAKQELDRHLAQVKADCREKLRSTTIQWERAVLQERKALKEVKQRKDKWQRRLELTRNAFRGHCVKTGVYARSVDAGRRAFLDRLIPREKVELPGNNPKPVTDPAG
ncbi:unnamed protein product, partial [Effrenium voratum]